MEKSAFTLAEVLITLAIIGVVAAITIPTLFQNSQENALKQAWKKNYSVIAQAYEKTKNDHGGDIAEYFNSTEHFAADPFIREMAQNLSIVENCFPNTAAEINSICGAGASSSLTNAYKTLNGGYLHQSDLASGQYILKDGTHLFFRTWNSGTPFTVYADGNGYNKGPNTLGKDLFGLVITKDKAIPMGASGTGAVLEDSCKISGVGACPMQYGFTWGNTPSCAGAGCSAEYLYK